MTTDVPPPPPAAQASTPPPSPDPMTVDRLARASERFMAGMTTLMTQQMTLGQRMMEGGVEDFRLLASADTPEGLLKAELEVLERRRARAFAAIQTFNDGFTKAFSELYGVRDGP